MSTFVCLCCIKKYPLSAHRTKNAERPETFKVGTEIEGSWLISAWISEKILSQLIIDVAPTERRHVNSVRPYLKFVELLWRSRQLLAVAHTVYANSCRCPLRPFIAYRPSSKSVGFLGRGARCSPFPHPWSPTPGRSPSAACIAGWAR